MNRVLAVLKSECLETDSALIYFANNLWDIAKIITRVEKKSRKYVR